ncbi:MAG: redoxin domain-containing protein [Acidobacteriota bacterium]|nr:redoxin domain-containing protein [Acidobacteriota bacterium]MDH3784810.1 redoxin domain-containing protein [Acidobacteriota bacterium]
MKSSIPWVGLALIWVACAAPITIVTDLEGNDVDPIGSESVTVLIFTRTDCPISNRYAPEIERIHREFADQGVDLWLVYVDPDETPVEIRQHLAEYSYGLPALRDPDHVLVARTGAEITPEVAVFNERQEMVYRGRIDDRFVDFGKTRAEATQHDLRETLQALVDDREVTLRTTSAVGCIISDLE